MPFQVGADVAGAKPFDPGEPVIVLLYVIASVLLASAGISHTPGTTLD